MSKSDDAILQRLQYINEVEGRPYYKEERICMTWKDGQAVLLREYSREKKGREKQGILRKERQEYPRTTISEASKSFHR